MKAEKKLKQKSNIKTQWLKYLAVSALSLGIGYFFSSIQIKDHIKEISLPAGQQQAPQSTQQPQNAKQQKSGASNPLKSYRSKLINQLAGHDPKLFEKIQQEHEDSILKRMFAETAIKDSAFAALFLNEINQEETKQMLVGNLIGRWISSDPISAYEWFEQLNLDPNEPIYLHHLEAIFPALIEKEPEYAWRIIHTIAEADQNQKEATVLELAESWVNKDLTAAFDWLNAMAASEEVSLTTLEQCYSTAITKYMEEDPVLGAQTVLDVKSESLQSLLVAPVVSHLAEQDLNAAMDWVLDLDTKTARESGINQIISSYASSEEEEPETLINYVLSNTDLSEKGIDLISYAFSSASEQNPSLAAQKLDEVPETARARVIESITENWLYQDERRAFEWLNNQPIGSSLDVGAATAAHYYRYEKPKLALEWASIISNPEKREKLLNELVADANRDDL